MRQNFLNTGALAVVSAMAQDIHDRDMAMAEYYRSLPKTESLEHRKLRENRKKKKHQRLKSIKKLK